ncbi:MAG: C1 family peptidase [Bacteroidaceae bacterium]|nr:C1 family peptidase [Bacteroidaceae bacterium]
MKRTILCALFVGMAGVQCSIIHAQTSITPDVLKQLGGSYTGTPAEKALRNAISNVGLAKMAINQENVGAKDKDFTIEVKNTGITDQKSSGRCWLFTGLNILRGRAMRKLGTKDLVLSQCYLFFYDQLEKSNLFLQGIIDTRKQPIDSEMVRWLFQHPLSDGGTYTGVADLATKYGVVPADIMPETYVSNSTSEFCGHLKRKLREFGITLREKSEAGMSEKQLQALKVEQLGTVYKMLVMAYGVPPKNFTWKDKSYTPQEFFKTYCIDEGEDLNRDYVMLMNDPSRPYNTVFEIDYDRHVYDGHNWLYVNLPIEDLKGIAIASLKDSCQMYFSCDVNKFLDRSTGIADLGNFDYGSLLGTTFGMNKKQRIQTLDSGSTHAMTLMAVDLDNEGKAKKWKVENSWGSDSGMNGYIMMTDEWFREYMFRVVANRRYCPASVLEMLKQKPIRLPAWDPMFSEED